MSSLWFQIRVNLMVDACSRGHVEKAVALVDDAIKTQLGTNSWYKLADIQELWGAEGGGLARRDLASTTSPLHVLLNLNLAQHMCYQA